MIRTIGIPTAVAAKSPYCAIIILLFYFPCIACGFKMYNRLYAFEPVTLTPRADGFRFLWWGLRLKDSWGPCIDKRNIFLSLKVAVTECAHARKVLLTRAKHPSEGRPNILRGGGVAMRFARKLLRISIIKDWESKTQSILLCFSEAKVQFASP